MKPLALLASILATLLALASPAAAVANDRDHDQLPDRWEHQHRLSVTHASANGDPDRDGVDNRNEHREGTDPQRRDSNRNGRADGREDADRDGLANAAEDASGNDPIDPDSDDDGVRDGRERSGTVISFAAGVLRIRLASGGSAKGVVDETTELACRTEARYEGGQHGLRTNRKRGRGHAKPGRSARVAADDDDLSGDEEPVEDDDSGSDDDPATDDEAGDDLGDDEIWPDDEAFEENWDDEESGESGGSCPVKRLRRGARVHESELAGSLFVAVALVR